MAEDSSTKVVVVKPSKEELLQMMEKVDRDISALESQIVNLQKTQVTINVLQLCPIVWDLMKLST